MMVLRADGSFLESVLHHHHTIRIRENAAGKTAAHILQPDIFIKRTAAVWKLWRGPLLFLNNLLFLNYLLFLNNLLIFFNELKHLL